jgi:hypothetical protein
MSDISNEPSWSFVIVMVFCGFVVVRRALSLLAKWQGLVNESKSIRESFDVNWFFQRGKKKRLRGFVASTWGTAFVLRGDGMAGGRRKRLVGGLSAQ